MKAEKRTYHPLVMYLYFTGKLSDEYCNQIPSTTLHYWKTLNHTNMYGYDWVCKTCDNIEKLEFTTKKQIIRKSTIICSRIINAISHVYEGAYNKTKLRKHAHLLVKTIDALSSNIPFKTACRILKVSEQQYYRWKNNINCSASVLNLCFKIHPNQLTIDECIIVEKAVKDKANEGKPLSTIYFNVLRKGELFISKSTFYKYAKLFQETRHFNKRSFKEINKFRAQAPFEYLHIDTTKIFTQDQGWQRAVFVKDNYSKTLLYKTIVPSAGSKYIKEVINKTFEKYDLENSANLITIVSDNGSENKGELTKWILNNKHVSRIIAQQNNNFSNNMVESSNHQFKNVFLKNKELPKTKTELEEYLETFETYINKEWTPGEFFGLTPIEVLNGEIPDKTRFAEDIKYAQKLRIKHNRNIGLEICKECIKVINRK